MEISFLEFIKSALFPIRCLGCKTFDTWLCPTCLSFLPKNGSPLCLLCHQRETKNGKICAPCKKQTGISHVLSCGTYANPLLQKAIKQYKFGSSRELADPLAELLFKAITDQYFYEWLEKYEPICAPVPLHKTRMRERGFNQSSELAKKVADYFGLQIEENLLIKKHSTRPQTECDHQKRLHNIKKSFLLNPQTGINGRAILLVDDVVTTGSTLIACAAELQKISPRRVAAITLAFG